MRLPRQLKFRMKITTDLSSFKIFSSEVREDIAVSRPFNVMLQTSVNGKVFDRSPSLNRDLKIRGRRRQRERHKSNKFN